MTSDQKPDPLDEVLASYTLDDCRTWTGARKRLDALLAVIRLLKGGHGKDDAWRPSAAMKVGGEGLCYCGRVWPCDILAEAAKILRGGDR